MITKSFLLLGALVRERPEKEIQEWDSPIKCRKFKKLATQIWDFPLKNWPVPRTRCFMNLITVTGPQTTSLALTRREIPRLLTGLHNNRANTSIWKTKVRTQEAHKLQNLTWLESKWMIPSQISIGRKCSNSKTAKSKNNKTTKN